MHRAPTRKAGAQVQGWRRWTGSPSLAALFLVGCVTVYEDIDPNEGMDPAAQTTPIAIEIPDRGDGAGRLLLEFYSGVLRRLEDAAAEGDVALLDSLVQSYDKPSAPAEIREQIRGYRAVARGIAFVDHMTRRSSIELVSDDPGETRIDRHGREVPVEPEAPPIGEPLRMELVVPAMQLPVVLGADGSEDSFGFWVSVRIDDEFADGGATWSRQRRYVPLSAAADGGPIVLSGNVVLRLPIDLDLEVGRAVRRTVLVRVETMPGHVYIDGLRVPVPRRSISAATWSQWPEGHELLEERPLDGLEAALQDFRPKNFAAVWLCCVLMPAADRTAATELLIDQVRYGTPDQAKVAMAGLQKLTGMSIAIGHRDGWLEWWQAHRR